MATKAKARKKPKLRHAEYYDFQSIQDRLYADSEKGEIFKGLVEIISLPENIRLAYRNIKKNSGSQTAGTDNRTIKDLERFSDEQLIQTVQSKLSWYVPQSVRRVEIPKSSDPSKKRPLGIPTIMDRLIQQCVLQVLEPICEAKFHDQNYGFRPNRSQENAISKVYNYMQLRHLHYVVDIDIKGFFDNVNHGKLLKQLWTLGIRDKKLLSILSAMLKAEVAGIGFPEKGTPQGGIISPLLANVVLNELDWWLASQWECFPTRHQFKVERKDGSVNRGNKFASLRASSNLKEIAFVRYADDFKIFTSSYQSAVKLFHATQKWLKDRLGLNISPEKSKVINLKEQYSEFLGFKMKVIPRGKRPDGSLKYVVESHIKDKALEKIKGNLDRLIYDIEFPTHGKRTEYNAICKYNAYVLGIHEYYQMATQVCNDLHSIAFSVHKSLKARLHSRIKTAKVVKEKNIPCKTPAVIQERYGKSGQLRYVGGCALVPIGYARCKIAKQKKWTINSYTPEGRAEIHKNLKTIDMDTLHYLMRNPVLYRSVEYNDNRLSLYSAQQGKCAVTGKSLLIGDIHCHHKVPKHMGGTDKYRNLVLVCEKVHRLIHATNPDTVEKYMNALKLTSKQSEKLNRLRSLVSVENC
ncbi:MAG TPA: group II intron reverse transcriptase/maturase [Clostridia bacterium]|nr:group II intron reverse transcriptase/maturase [Clostridia bacterium]